MTYSVLCAALLLLAAGRAGEPVRQEPHKQVPVKEGGFADKPPADVDKQVAEKQKQIAEKRKQIARLREEITGLQTDIERISPPLELAGEWVVVEERQGDRTLRGKDLFLVGLTFTKNTVVRTFKDLEGPGAVTADPLAYLLDEETNPRKLNWYTQQRNGQLGLAHRCICKMDGTHLVVAIAGAADKPPTSFERPGQDVQILRLTKKE